MLTDPCPSSSLTMSLVNRVTGTGPTSATMAPMVVDLVFGGVPWGKLQLPEVVTASVGTEVRVQEQDVAITNLDAFRAFVRALMRDDELVLTLDNGDCHVASKILGFTARSTVVYKKDLLVRGMRGPRVALAGTAGGQNTMKVTNPSPMEIDHGVSMFEIVQGQDEVVAEVKGPMYIVRGNFDTTMDITFKGKKVEPGAKLRLVGKGTENESWMNDTLKYIDSEFEADLAFATASG